MRKKKISFFRKQFSKFWASDNSHLQIKWSLQNKTTDHNNYTYIKTILSTQIDWFVTTGKGLESFMKKTMSWGLQIKDCKSQLYDNTSNMKSKNVGFQVLFLQ